MFNSNNNLQTIKPKQTLLSNMKTNQGRYNYNMDKSFTKSRINCYANSREETNSEVEIKSNKYLIEKSNKYLIEKSKQNVYSTNELDMVLHYLRLDAKTILELFRRYSNTWVDKPISMDIIKSWRSTTNQNALLTTTNQNALTSYDFVMRQVGINECLYYESPRYKLDMIDRKGQDYLMGMNKDELNSILNYINREINSPHYYYGYGYYGYGYFGFNVCDNLKIQKAKKIIDNQIAYIESPFYFSERLYNGKSNSQGFTSVNVLRSMGQNSDGATDLDGKSDGITNLDGKSDGVANLERDLEVGPSKYENIYITDMKYETFKILVNCTSDETPYTFNDFNETMNIFSDICNYDFCGVCIDRTMSYLDRNQKLFNSSFPCSLILGVTEYISKYNRSIDNIIEVCSWVDEMHTKLINATTQLEAWLKIQFVDVYRIIIDYFQIKLLSNS